MGGSHVALEWGRAMKLHKRDIRYLGYRFASQDGVFGALQMALLHALRVTHGSEADTMIDDMLRTGELHGQYVQGGTV